MWVWKLIFIFYIISIAAHFKCAKRWILYSNYRKINITINNEMKCWFDLFHGSPSLKTKHWHLLRNSPYEGLWLSQFSNVTSLLHCLTVSLGQVGDWNTMDDECILPSLGLQWSHLPVLLYLVLVDGQLPGAALYLAIGGGEDDHVGHQDDHAGAEHGDDDGQDDVKLAVFLCMEICKGKWK